jgi:glycosyltransferase involved in cell wall biosynthesis
MPEIVRDGDTGFLVPPGDVTALSDRVGRLLGDRDLGTRMGRAARESVLEAFTWDHCARRCLGAYQEREGEVQPIAAV